MSREQSTVMLMPVLFSDVKSLKTSWPRGQNFVLGLGLQELSSASSI